MVYGIVVTMAHPVATYDAIHAALIAHAPGPDTGLLTHLGRATPDGFQIVEVWESRELAERYNRDVVWPVTARVTGGAAGPPPVVEELDLHGLVVPGAGIAW